MYITRRSALGLIGSATCASVFFQEAAAAPAKIALSGRPIRGINGTRQTKARITGGFVCAAPGGNGISLYRYTSSMTLEVFGQRLQFPGTTGTAIDLVMNPNGSALAVVAGVLTDQPGSESVFAVPFNDDGVATGPVQRISPVSTEPISKISACLLTDGRTLVAWRDSGLLSEYANIFYRYIDDAGVPVSQTFVVKRTSGRAAHTLLSVARLPNGEAFIAYFKRGATYDKGDALLQRIDATGAPVGAPVYLGATVKTLDMAATPEGVVTIWAQDEGPANGAKIGMRKVAIDGTRGNTKRIATGLYYIGQNNIYNEGPKITRTADGRFAAVVGGSYLRPDDYADHYVKAYALSGSLNVFNEVNVGFIEDPRDQYMPGMTSGFPLLNNGALVAAWRGAPTIMMLQRLRFG